MNTTLEQEVAEHAEDEYARALCALCYLLFKSPFALQDFSLDFGASSSVLLWISRWSARRSKFDAGGVPALFDNRVKRLPRGSLS